MVHGFHRYSDGDGGTLAVHGIPGVSASVYDGGHLWRVTGDGGLAGSKNATTMYPESGEVSGSRGSAWTACTLRASRYGLG